MKIRYADRKRFRVGTAKIAKKVGIAAANVLKITLFDKSDGYRLNLTAADHHPRAVDQGPGYGYPLFLAPGKL